MKKNKSKIQNTLQILNPLEDAKDSVSTTVKLVISALTLVSALAWNEAIKGIFELLKENEIFKSTGFLAPFLYAIIVTVLTILVINRIQKIEKKIVIKEKKKK
jgi:hypothetical protein